MKYNELPIHWQRIFELEWKSVCEGSKAIAAVIAAKELVESGYFEGRILAEISAEEVFDVLAGRFVYA